MSNAWLQDYCNSTTVWNASLLDEEYPSFTQCFQQIILVWVPCALLWIMAPFHFFALKNSGKTSLNLSKLYISKLVMSSLVVVLSLAQMSYPLYRLDQFGISLNPGDYVSPAIIAITSVLAVVMLIASRKHGEVSSGILFLYWLLLLLCAIIPLTEQIRNFSDPVKHDTFNFVTHCIYFGFLLMIVFLNCWAEAKEKLPKLCPEKFSSFLNKIFFWWFNPLIVLGYKHPLTMDELWDLNISDQSHQVSPEFHHLWEQEMEKSRKSMEKEAKEVYINRTLDKDLSEQLDYMKAPYRPSLVKALGKKFWKTFLVSALFKLCNDLIQFVSPLLLSLMIGFTEDLGIPLWRGYFYAASMYIVAIVQAIMLQQYFHRCYLIGMKIRTVVISIIYHKSLRISNSARQESTVGEIVNLMSTDAQRFMDLMSYIHILWSGPLQIIIAVVFLWQILDYAVLAGLAVMIIMIPLNGVIIKRMRRLSMENMKFKDQRIKLMNEILSGIKVLKLYAWEPSFEKQVLDIRSKELRISKKIAYLRAITSFLWNCTPFIVSLTSFGVYLVIDENHVLDSETAFVSLSLFNILRFPLVMIPAMITSVTQAQVSVKRMTKFLVSSEIDPESVDRNPDIDEQVVVKNGTFAWDKTSENILSDINLRVKPGELVAVVGHVGSGKSSLISAILGEMEKKKGYVGVKGSVAYVPQQAWIQNATLQNNILFGKSLNDDDVITTSFSAKWEPRSSKDFYKEVIKATALEKDLEILDAGDQTEIGEKGINLSGGQKQRVSLARAVFSQSDLYLLDDPLSAVDSHIGKHIFEKLIGRQGMLRDKTRILVTHGVRYLPHVDRIIVLDKGRITEEGNYQELLAQGKDFAKFLEEYATKQDESDDESDETSSGVVDDVSLNDLESVPDNADDVSEFDKNFSPDDDVIRQEHRNSIRLRHSRVSSKRKGGSPKAVADVKGKLTEKESIQEGSVKFGVFWIYMKAVGLLMCFAIFSTEGLYQVSVIGASLWLSDWSEDADSLPVNESRAQTDYRLGVYGALGAAQALFICMDVFILFIGCLHAAKILHYKMLSNILKAPVSFFDTTPIGRIVNRFSKDVYTVDEMLPMSLRSWNGCMFQVVGIIVVIMYSTPEFGIVIVPVAILYFVAQRFYVRTSRQLKRLESVTRSPIYSHFSETLSGVTTVRAYAHQRRFVGESEQKVDTNQKCYYPNIVSNRWLAIRLDVIGNAIVFFAALFAVLGRGTVTGALAGLSLSYALNITSTLNWWVRQTSETEIHVVAVERQKEFADIDSEAPYDVKDTKPTSQWPNKGAIKFDKYSTRYREGLDLVLRNISCSIEPGEKVGVVGRTGAGKSSLTLALFRLIEPASGSIVIDDVDVAKIGLHDLRSKVTIIPQDPVLFSGSLRMNLDPFDLYSDDEVWGSLQLSHLDDFVTSLPGKLEHICSEGGENLSVGQRQLICLARALLRKTRILVLDEATAAVDMKTDDLIQKTIRDQFMTSTVITIAHRLNTIMDYNRIVVLDCGEICEMGSPADLLASKSVFYGMAKDAGLA